MPKKKTEGVGRKRTPRKPVSPKPGPPKGRTGLVTELLKKVEEKLTADDVKATLGDYIRLVQLQKEMEETEPREIKVTWVEPEATESDSGK